MTNMSNTEQGPLRRRGTTAEDLLNKIRDGSWRDVPYRRQYIAAPVPSQRPVSLANILDNEWQHWRGGVRLASNKPLTVQGEYMGEESRPPPPNGTLRQVHDVSRLEGAEKSAKAIESGAVRSGTEHGEAVDDITNLLLGLIRREQLRHEQERAERAGEVNALLNDLLVAQQRRRAQERMKRQSDQTANLRTDLHGEPGGRSSIASIGIMPTHTPIDNASTDDGMESPTHLPCYASSPATSTSTTLPVEMTETEDTSDTESLSSDELDEPARTEGYRAYANNTHWPWKARTAVPPSVAPPSLTGMFSFTRATASWGIV